MDPWRGNRGERLEWEKESSTPCLTDDKNRSSDNKRHYLCLRRCTVSHHARQKAQGLPEKNVTLSIRKEQATMSNDHVIMAFV